MNETVNAFAIEGAGTSVVHPLGLVIFLICGILLVFLPRKHAMWPLLILVCFVSNRQCIAIAGMNLYLGRLLACCFGLIRGVVRREIFSIKINRIDIFLIAYVAIYLVMGMVSRENGMAVLKLRLGYSMDILGIYTVSRMIIRDSDTLRAVASIFAFVAIPLFFLFLFERISAINLFSIFGGVPEYTVLRGGRLRCQGAFGHPILAGVFWASSLPLSAYAVMQKAPRKVSLELLGFLSTIGIIVLSASSTPILGLAISILGLLLFPLRRFMKVSFYAFLVGLFFLHMAMEAPVWSLIQRINITSGNSGYHRYILIDGFITHFQEWWVTGSRIGTGHWGHFTYDIANQYVSVGVGSGLVALVVFATIMVMAIKHAVNIDDDDPLLGWCVLVSLVVLAICFIGISVWGQLHFIFGILLSVVASLSFSASNSDQFDYQDELSDDQSKEDLSISEDVIV